MFWQKVTTNSISLYTQDNPPDQQHELDQYEYDCQQFFGQIQNRARKMIQFDREFHPLTDLSINTPHCLIYDQTTQLYLIEKEACIDNIEILLNIKSLKQQICETLSFTLQLNLCIVRKQGQTYEQSILPKGINGKYKLTDIKLNKPHAFTDLTLDNISHGNYIKLMVIAYYKDVGDIQQNFCAIYYSPLIRVIDEKKIYKINTKQSLQHLFTYFGLQQLSALLKKGKSKGHVIPEQMSNFARHFFRKDNKNNNLLYLSVKFNKIFSLFFKLDKDKSKTIEEMYFDIFDKINLMKEKPQPIENIKYQCNSTKQDSLLIVQVNNKFKRPTFIIHPKLLQFVNVIIVDESAVEINRNCQYAVIKGIQDALDFSKSAMKRMNQMMPFVIKDVNRKGRPPNFQSNRPKKREKNIIMRREFGGAQNTINQGSNQKRYNIRKIKRKHYSERLKYNQLRENAQNKQQKRKQREANTEKGNAQNASEKQDKKSISHVNQTESLPKEGKVSVKIAKEDKQALHKELTQKLQNYQQNHHKIIKEKAEQLKTRPSITAQLNKAAILSNAIPTNNTNPSPNNTNPSPNNTNPSPNNTNPSPNNNVSRPSITSQSQYPNFTPAYAYQYASQYPSISYPTYFQSITPSIYPSYSYYPVSSYINPNVMPIMSNPMRAYPMMSMNPMPMNPMAMNPMAIPQMIPPIVNHMGMNPMQTNPNQQMAYLQLMNKYLQAQNQKP